MGKLSPSIIISLILFLGLSVFVSGDISTSPDTTQNDTNTVELVKTDAVVKRVKDGDTVVLKVGQKEETIRLLLIDTPESVHPDKEPQPFGKEASDYAKRYLKNGKKVTLEVGNPDRDKYGRLLGYVWVDGVNFNQHMIEKGFARVAYIVPPNTKYLSDFEKAERQAMVDRTGIWSKKGYVTNKGFN